MSKPILAWHFTKGMKLRDGQDLIEGKTYHVDPPLLMCSHGLHASIDFLDALRYAPGSTLSRVELSGDIIKEYDKIVATDRKVLKVYGEINLLKFYGLSLEAEILYMNLPFNHRCWGYLEIIREVIEGNIHRRDRVLAEMETELQKIILNFPNKKYTSIQYTYVSMLDFLYHTIYSDRNLNRIVSAISYVHLNRKDINENIEEYLDNN